MLWDVELLGKKLVGFAKVCILWKDFVPIRGIRAGLVKFCD